MALLLALVVLTGLPFTSQDKAHAATGPIVRCSSNASGQQGNASSYTTSINANGRYVAFASSATNLVPGGTTGQEIFRKDLQTGQVVCCSSDAAGQEGNGDSNNPVISSDGRYVAFDSNSSNLVVGGGTSRRVYRKDLQTGQVVCCSTDAAGVLSFGNNPSMSPDGRYVAFESTSTTLVPGISGFQVFRKDLQTGQVACCSTDAAGVQGDHFSANPAVSSDGRYVAFDSLSSNLVPGTSGSQIFRKDLQTGQIVVCSSNASGQPGNSDAEYPAISSDGRYVAFRSNASNLIPGNTYGLSIYRKDLQTGQIVCCSSDADGYRSNGMSDNPAITPDGKYVAFESDANDLVPGVSTLYDQVYLKNIVTGEISCCSTSLENEQGNEGGTLASVSSDGRYVSFRSRSDNLVPGEVGGYYDIFRKEPLLEREYPVINSITPSSGCAGSMVVISGDHFGDTRGDSTVIFGSGEIGDYISWSNTSIGFKVPRSVAGYSQVVQVKVDGLLSNEVTFTVESFAVGFAEGYTGEGFQEYLCIGNPQDYDVRVQVVYLFTDSTYLDDYVTVPARSRTTVDVNYFILCFTGQGMEVSIMVFSDTEIVVERPMYFNYQGRWTGGHDAVGTPYVGKYWFFAEGYTGGGFEEWICVLNPGETAANLTFRFQTEEAGEIVRGGSVPPASRSSFKVNDLLGPGYQCSLALESDQFVVAERSMYFDYTGMGNHHWQGGHCVMGLPGLAKEYNFAEGTTRPGFEEWLTLQNPGASPIDITATYQFGAGQGDPVSKTYTVPGGERYTVFVPDEVGTEKDVSVKLVSDSYFLAERPMYFRYTGYGASWEGGHCVIGALDLSSDWFFAEGCTSEGFNEWLCLQNPGNENAELEVTYLVQNGSPIQKTTTVPARSRKTLFVNEDAGPGLELSCILHVTSGPPIVAERPVYFSFKGWDGGHDVIGYYAAIPEVAPASLDATGIRETKPLRDAAGWLLQRIGD